MTEVTDRIRKAPPQRFRRYSQYKDSGVEWLGEIPAHWEVRRLKFVTHTVAGQSPPSVAVTDRMDGTDGLPFLQGNAEFGPLSPKPQKVCDSAPKRAEPGDILLSVRAPVGAMNVADQPYGIGRGLCAIRPAAGLDRSFCFYEVMAMRPLLDAVATGSTYDAVTSSDVGDLLILLPHQGEQHAIADFLDRETAKIDGLVARKERLIELLQEKRTALITRAVTRGLDPTVLMKDFGVEWLGEIPSHWDVRRIGATVTGCQNGVWGEEANGVDDVICVRVADFDRVQFRIRLDQPTMRSIEPRVVQSRRLRGEDLLLEKSGGGDKQPVGAVVMYDHREPAVCSNFVARMSVAEGYHPRYLTYLHAALYAARINVRSIKQSTGIQNLDSGSYLNESVGLPREWEQCAIAEFLDREAAKIDMLIARVQGAVDLLKEFRTALISAAVTGKIDVREEAA